MTNPMPTPPDPMTSLKERLEATSKELSRIIAASHQRPIKATEADLMRLKNKIDNSLFLTPYKTEEV